MRRLIVVGGVFFLHEAVLNGMRIAGVRPDLLLALTVVSGIVAGPALGAGTGFTCGVLADLFVNTPFGLTALVFSLVGFGVGSLQLALNANQRVSVPLFTTLASATATAVWAALATVLGSPGLLTPHLLVVVAVVASVNTLVCLPMRNAVRWAFASPPKPVPFRAAAA